MVRDNWLGQCQQPGQRWGKETHAGVSLVLVWTPGLLGAALALQHSKTQGLWGRDPQNPPDSASEWCWIWDPDIILRPVPKLYSWYGWGVGPGPGGAPCVLWCLLSSFSPGSASRCWGWGVLVGLGGLCRELEAARPHRQASGAGTSTVPGGHYCSWG